MIRKKGSEEEKEYLRTNKWKLKKKNYQFYHINTNFSRHSEKTSAVRNYPHMLPFLPNPHVVYIFFH